MICQVCNEREALPSKTLCRTCEVRQKLTAKLGEAQPFPGCVFLQGRLYRGELTSSGVIRSKSESQS
jgi:hypothetical protein